MPVRSVLAQPKRFALLAYLAASWPPSQRRRDTCLAIFWPELDEEHARKALRQSLYGLRQALGPGVLTGKGEETLGVDPTRLWCDATAFSSATDSRCREEALKLYRGPFLEGFHLSGAPEFDRWMEGERRRLQLEAVEAAWQLVEGSDPSSDPLECRRRAERALELAPYDEESLRRYLQLMAGMGQRAAAIRAFDAYAERLDRELELEASPETRALVERIRTGPPLSSSAPRVAPSRPQAGDPRDDAAARARRAASGPAVRPSETKEPAGREKASRLPLLRTGGALALAAMTLPLLVALLWWEWGRLPPPVLDEERIAVLPFRVSGADPSVAFLGRGLPELLALTLTGGGGLPAAVPAAEMDRRLRQRLGTRAGAPGGLTHEEALAVTRDAGAGRLLTGSLVGSSTRVTVRAVVVDAVSGDTVLEAGISEPPDSLYRLTDRIVARLYAADAGLQPARLATLTTASLPALRAYLEGWDAFTEGRFTDAKGDFDRALEHDSTFTLAAFQYARVSAWAPGYHGSNHERAFDIARARRDELPEPDRLFVEANWPNHAEWVDEAALLRHRRALVERRPDLPELRFLLADSYYHIGEAVGIRDAKSLARRHFEAAAATDTSRIAPEPLTHLFELAVAEADTAAAFRWGEMLLRQYPGSPVALRVRYAWTRLFGRVQNEEIDLDTIPSQVLGEWLLLPTRFDTALVDLRYARREEARTEGLHTGWEATHFMALWEGRPSLALREFDAMAEKYPDEEDQIRLATAWWAGDTARATAAAHEMRRRLPDPLRLDGAGMRLADVSRACYYGKWRLERGDTAVGLELARQLDTLAVAGSSPRDNARANTMARHCAALLFALEAVTSGRPGARERVERVDHLHAAQFIDWRPLPRDITSWIADLWERLGEPGRALAVTRRQVTYLMGHGYRTVDFYYHAARLADRLGQRREAVDGYRLYVAWRGRAEEPFREEVRHARERLAVLSHEP